jgi:hypothetical protein
MTKPPVLPTTGPDLAEAKRTGVETYRQGLGMALVATAVAFVIFSLLAIYAIPRGGRLSTGTEIAMLLGFTAYVHVLCLFGAVQRVDIDHDRRTIRVANKDTHQRWLGFRMEDVTGIRRLSGYRLNALAMDLATAPGRSRNVAIFNNAQWMGDDRSALFVALAAAVLAVNPDVPLTGFSEAYGDRFRRPGKREAS